MTLRADDRTSAELYAIDGVLVDAETGEIIDMAAGSDAMAAVTRAGLEATQQIKVWERYQQAMKHAADTLLGVQSQATTLAGKAQRITQHRRTAPREHIMDAAALYELAPAQVQALYECAAALDPKLIDAAVAQGTIDGPVADMLIDERTIEYVQFTALRKPGPVPEAR